MHARWLAATLGLVAAASLAPLASPARAQAAAAAETAEVGLGEAPEARRYDATQVVCRRTRPPTGSRVARGPRGERICLTMAEWDRRSDEAQQNLRERDRGLCGGHASGGCTMPGVAPGSER
jgi:hypothetical protein